MKELSESAAKLFRVLVEDIQSGKYVPDDPDTFIGYGEARERMNLPDDAAAGVTAGETLQLNGLNDLAEWVHKHPARLPAITGLIVSKSAKDFAGERRPENVPGSGYFTLSHRIADDWTWWLKEAKRAIAFDWKPYLPPDSDSSANLGSRLMNSLERSIIEKAGYDNGFEHNRESGSSLVRLSSARHKAEVRVTPAAAGEKV